MLLCVYVSVSMYSICVYMYGGLGCAVSYYLVLVHVCCSEVWSELTNTSCPLARPDFCRIAVVSCIWSGLQRSQAELL